MHTIHPQARDVLQNNRPSGAEKFANMQPLGDSFSGGPNNPSSPQAKKKRLNPPEGQASRRSRFFCGDDAGDGVSGILAPHLPNPVSSRPTGGVGVPTEEDRATGLWSPERSASPQLPSQGIAKRLQLSQIPISHRSMPAGNPSPFHPSPSKNPDDAGTLHPEKSRPEPNEKPGLRGDNLYDVSSCILRQPQPPSRGRSGCVPLPEISPPQHGGLHQGDVFSRQFKIGGRDCESQSAGGSSGGAKGAACEDCDFKDEYASVFDFL